MAQRGKRRRDVPGETRREPVRRERPRVDAPPGLSASITFPWASVLAIGWGAEPVHAASSRASRAAPKRRRRAAE